MTIRHFYTGTLDSASFSEIADDGETPQEITKSGLLLVEGTHVDSKKRTHTFTPERLQRIVENTNRWLASGGRIPWQRDHKKTQADNIGDLEGGVELKVIEFSDLANPKLRHLVGKLGVVTRNLVGKGADVVRDIVTKKISTISPGIDIETDIIKEISATPIPAITGLSVFNKYDSSSANFALTLDEAEAEQQDISQYKEQFEDLCEMFWGVVTNIQSATEEELQGTDPNQLIDQAINDFGDRIAEMLGMFDDPNGEMGDMGDYPGNQYGASPQPGYMQKQQEMMPRRQQAQYSTYEDPIAGFSMAEVERNLAEFGYGNLIKQSAKRIGGSLKAGQYGAAAKELGRTARIAGSRVIGGTRRNMARLGRMRGGAEAAAKKTIGVRRQARMFNGNMVNLPSTASSTVRANRGASGFSQMSDAQKAARKQALAQKRMK